MAVAQKERIIYPRSFDKESFDRNKDRREQFYRRLQEIEESSKSQTPWDSEFYHGVTYVLEDGRVYVYTVSNDYCIPYDLEEV